MIDRRFVYTGSAVGVGARITRIGKNDGLQFVVPVQGSSALPQTGGIAESKTGRFAHKIRHPERNVVVKVGSTMTRASGLADGSSFRTEVTSAVKDVNFYDMLHIDSATAAMLSVHDGHNDYPLIAPTKAEIRGLRLGKDVFEVEFDLEPFQACKTKGALTSRYATDPDFRKACAGRFNADGESARLPEFHGYIVASAVKSIRRLSEKTPDIRIDGYTIVWEGANGFGAIVLGEILISDYLRRFSLVRLRMGSDVAGDGTVTAVESNGSTMP